MNTLNRKSWADLTRHRTRTLLAAGTLSIAIASLGFLAVPGLLNAAMSRQVQQARLNEVAISTRVIDLSPAQLAALGRLPGVAAVSADLRYVTTTLAYTPGANSTGTPVFYASAATAQALAGVKGFNHLGFRLTDDSHAAQNRVIAEVRAYLTAQTGSDPITSLPYTRTPGYWPGQTGFSNLMAVLYIITVPRVRLRLVPDLGHDEHAHRRAGPRDRHPQGARRPAAADRRHHRPHRGDARPGGRDRRHYPRRRRRLPAGPLLRREDRRRVVRLRRVGPVIAGSLVAGPVLAVAASLPGLRRALRRPVAGTLTGPARTGATGPAGSTGWPRAAARPGGCRTACAWDSATCCGNGGAAWR